VVFGVPGFSFIILIVQPVRLASPHEWMCPLLSCEVHFAVSFIGEIENFAWVFAPQFLMNTELGFSINIERNEG